MPKAPLRVLIVDDEKDVREPIALYLIGEGYRAETANCTETALILLSKRTFDIVVTDIQMPGMTGLELLTHIRTHYTKTAVIIFTAFGSMETAISALKSGASDYLLKPVQFEDLRAKIDRVAARALEKEHTGTVSTADPLTIDTALQSILGESPAIIELKKVTRRVAGAGSFVVIQGESGTGKELVARALHEESARRNHPFVAVNCAAIPEQLVESEFFGYLKGAFTGADADKKGLMDSSHQGTLFLDEVVELPLAMQAKLLRSLEMREVTPLGATRPHPVELTVVAACASDLSQAVLEGRFRSDLFYRLNVIEIKLPPLREHNGDVLILATHFLEATNQRLDTAVSGITEDALQCLKAYSWPGNVRELRNVIERSVVMSLGDQIEVGSLPEHIKAQTLPPKKPVRFRDAVKEFEREMITKTLDSCGGDKKLAAEILGIGVSTLYRLLDDGSTTE